MRELPFLSLPASVRESRSRGCRVGEGGGQTLWEEGNEDRKRGKGGGGEEKKIHLTDVKSRTAAKRKNYVTAARKKKKNETSVHSIHIAAY